MASQSTAKMIMPLFSSAELTTSFSRIADWYQLCSSRLEIRNFSVVAIPINAEDIRSHFLSLTDDSTVPKDWPKPALPGSVLVESNGKAVALLNEHNGEIFSASVSGMFASLKHYKFPVPKLHQSPVALEHPGVRWLQDLDAAVGSVIVLPNEVSVQKALRKLGLPISFVWSRPVKPVVVEKKPEPPKPAEVVEKKPEPVKPAAEPEKKPEPPKPNEPPVAVQPKEDGK